MIDLKLCFPDAATGLAALLAAGIDASADAVTGGAWGACVTGLSIIATPETVDAAGDVTAPATFAPGWHADLRLMHASAAPEALAAFVVVPGNPQHTFA